MLGTKQWLGSGLDSAAGIGRDNIERTVAVDPACSFITRNDKPPYSKVEEIFAALEQVSNVLQVESSDAVG